MGLRIMTVNHPRVSASVAKEPITGFGNVLGLSEWMLIPDGMWQQIISCVPNAWVGI